MKYLKDPSGNTPRVLSPCNAVPQATALSCAPIQGATTEFFQERLNKNLFKHEPGRKVYLRNFETCYIWNADHKNYHFSQITALTLFSNTCSASVTVATDCGKYTEFPGMYRATCAVAQLVEALRYKPEVRGFDSRWSCWNFSVL
jgi:hypothetical protein